MKGLHQIKITITTIYIYIYIYVCVWVCVKWEQYTIQCTHTVYMYAVLYTHLNMY